MWAGKVPSELLRSADAFSAALTAVQVAPAPGKPPPSGPGRAGDLPPGPPLDVPPTLQRIRTAVSPMPEQGSQLQATAPGERLTVRASVKLHAQTSMTWPCPRHQASQCLSANCGCVVCIQHPVCWFARPFRMCIQVSPQPIRLGALSAWLCLLADAGTFTCCSAQAGPRHAGGHAQVREHQSGGVPCRHGGAPAAAAPAAAGHRPRHL